MFVGHFAMAFGAKKFAPRVSLGVLFLACQLADIIWPNLVLLGVETVRIEPGATAMTPLNFVHYPFSHSLVALVVWSLVLAGIYSLLKHADKKTILVIVLVVISHWVLDVLSHQPDMPITITGSTHLGLGLWNYPVAGVSIELLLFTLGFWSYLRHTSALDRTGVFALWGLAAFMLIIYVANVLGPIPPSTDAVAWSAQALWLLVAWGFWIDRHRTNRAEPVSL